MVPVAAVVDHADLAVGAYTYLFEDVMTYKAEHRRARGAALDALSRLDQETALAKSTGR